MEFRPCIDIHNGKVKQIVGSSLQDKGDAAAENFVSEQDGAFYAGFYRKHGIKGGHIILLNREGSEYYEATKAQTLSALRAYPGGMQAGGGITPENAGEYLDAGASHVIVTSYVFRNGLVDYDNLHRIVKAVGKKNLVLDLSCRRQSCRRQSCRRQSCPEQMNSGDEAEYKDGYYIVTDRWQKNTSVRLTESVLDEFASYCDEFLIHAVDVEGKAEGIETELAAMLGAWNGTVITYAGGVHSFEDLASLKKLGRNRINVTIGSALDLFGGNMGFRDVLEYVRNGED